MKCSLDISSFLEEISSLSRSIVFLYFFALIAEEDFLTFLSLLFFVTLHSNGYIFPFFLCLSYKLTQDWGNRLLEGTNKLWAYQDPGERSSDPTRDWHRLVCECPGRPSVQFSSVTQLCLTLCDPMNCSMPGLPVHHQFLEFTQTHVHQVGDAIQPSHPLSSPFPPAPNPSQHQSLFQWVNSSHEVAKVLEFQL